ncbi:alkaline phosphatase family protein, partial [Arthrobacter deserti]|nr:alkaline phosphatase family protein [Arthrobacter deserti]
PPFRWSGLKGPWFDNNLASLEVTPEGLKLWWDTGKLEHGDHLHPRLERVAGLTVAPRTARESARGPR